ncbi:MAG: M23 family metallopeptidase [Candidatus Dormibacteria bacterium]
MASDPLLAASVQAILTHPVAAEHPDLVHFRPQAAMVSDGSNGSGSGGSSGAARAGAMRALALAGGALFALAVAVAAPMVRLRTRLTRRFRQAGIALSLGATLSFACLGVLAVTSGPSGAGATTGPSRAASSSIASGSVLAALRSHTMTQPVGAASQPWSSLVSIETTLMAQHDSLVADEQKISDLVSDLAGTGSPEPAVETRNPVTPSVLKDQLQQAVNDHDALSTSYTASLQSEYGFFVTTVQSPLVASQLTTVAAHEPPQVQQAITTNLSLVQTQLQQEAEVATAAAAAAQLEADAANGTGPAVADLSGPAPSFHAPTSGVVTQPFGATELAMEPPITYNGVFYPHFHTGIDIATSLDTPLAAAAPGRVVLATSSVDSQGALTGYGNYVVIAHADGFLTLYAHLDKILVKPDHEVKQGEVIGLLGSTGSSTGPHVHFEVRKGSVYVDPAPFLADELKS